MQRYVLSHSDDERDLGLDCLFDCSRCLMGRNVDSRGIRLQLLHGRPYRRQDGQSQMLSGAVGLDAANDVCPPFY